MMFHHSGDRQPRVGARAERSADQAGGDRGPGQEEGAQAGGPGEGQGRAGQGDLSYLSILSVCLSCLLGLE